MTTFRAFLRGLFQRAASHDAPTIDPRSGAPRETQAALSVTGEPQTEADLLRAAMTKAGITDPGLRAGIAAICMGESALKPRSETSYSGTDNARIRRVFKLRVSGLNDAQLNELKRDDRRFFNWVYGMQWQSIHRLGNTDPGDGYRYRGRGLLQLTGRANYARYGEKIGRRQDMLDNPDLANEPAVAARLTAEYIKDRYHHGLPVDFDELCQCVGNNTPDIRARKDAYYRQFLASGEFA